MFLRWMSRVSTIGLTLGSPVLCHARQQDAVPSRVTSIRSQNLQMTPSDPSDPGSERWIVWDTGFGNGQAAAYIALCDTIGHCRWQHTWSDAYMPTVHYMGS